MGYCSQASAGTGLFSGPLSCSSQIFRFLLCLHSSSLIASGSNFTLLGMCLLLNSQVGLAAIFSLWPILMSYRSSCLPSSMKHFSITKASMPLSLVQAFHSGERVFLLRHRMYSLGICDFGRSASWRIARVCSLRLQAVRTGL